jgi:hypothetical protein
MGLPFLQAPATPEKRVVGNEASGTLEVPVLGGLTVGESATIQDLLAKDQSSFVKGAQAADAIAKAEGITLTEPRPMRPDPVDALPVVDHEHIPHVVRDFRVGLHANRDKDPLKHQDGNGCIESIELTINTLIINELDKNGFQQINLYPNPTSNLISVEIGVPWVPFIRK